MRVRASISVLRALKCHPIVWFDSRTGPVSFLRMSGDEVGLVVRDEFGSCWLWPLDPLIVQGLQNGTFAKD